MNNDQSPVAVKITSNQNSELTDEYNNIPSPNISKKVGPTPNKDSFTKEMSETLDSFQKIIKTDDNASVKESEYLCIKYDKSKRKLRVDRSSKFASFDNESQDQNQHPNDYAYYIVKQKQSEWSDFQLDSSHKQPFDLDSTQKNTTAFNQNTSNQEDKSLKSNFLPIDVNFIKKIEKSQTKDSDNNEGTKETTKFVEVNEKLNTSDLNTPIPRIDIVVNKKESQSFWTFDEDFQKRYKKNCKELDKNYFQLPCESSNLQSESQENYDYNNDSEIIKQSNKDYKEQDSSIIEGNYYDQNLQNEKSLNFNRRKVHIEKNTNNYNTISSAYRNQMDQIHHQKKVNEEQYQTIKDRQFYEKIRQLNKRSFTSNDDTEKSVCIVKRKSRDHTNSDDKKEQILTYNFNHSSSINSLEKIANDKYELSYIKNNKSENQQEFVEFYDPKEITNRSSEIIPKNFNVNFQNLSNIDFAKNDYEPSSIIIGKELSRENVENLLKYNENIDSLLGKHNKMESSLDKKPGFNKSSTIKSEKIATLMPKQKMIKSQATLNPNKVKDITSDNKSSINLNSCSSQDNRSLNQAIIKEIDTDDDEKYPRKLHHGHSNSETKLRKRKNKQAKKIIVDEIGQNLNPNPTKILKTSSAKNDQNTDNDECNFDSFVSRESALNNNGIKFLNQKFLSKIDQEEDNHKSA